MRTGVVVSASPTDAGSGVNQVAFYECDATLHAGCDPTNTSLFGAQIGATQTTAVAGVYSVAWSNTGLTDGHSYAIAAVATDNVANATTSSINTVVVDNSAPAVAVAAPVPVTGAAAQYYDAGSKTLFLKAAGQGSFTLEASASDAHTGIGSVTFPALLGTGSNTGTNTGGSNYESVDLQLRRHRHPDLLARRRDDHGRQRRHPPVRRHRDRLAHGHRRRRAGRHERPVPGRPRRLRQHARGTPARPRTAPARLPAATSAAPSATARAPASRPSR